ncbi:hypothetical protein BGX28_003375 [Mortierella sp. GBA30]|nr:hypothetical protein BGX28_003375 [Mortierella sp. GBA30]
MSPSLPPPPRNHSSSISSASGSARYPTVNPNSLAAAAAAADPTLDQDDQDLDQALAQLLGQSHIHPQQHTPPMVHHHPQCRHYGAAARPLSIASISSIGSGSYSSYGSTHSRRVSQACLSPLSPTLSEPPFSSNTSGGASYFSTLPEEEVDINDNETYPTDRKDDNVVSGMAQEQQQQQEEMNWAGSSFPSCDYCSSVRSNSICSSCTPDEKSIIINNNSNYNLWGLDLQQHDRNSMNAFFDNNRQAILKELAPSVVRHRLNYHLDECWFVHFSPSGKYLASTGLDRSILLWQNVAAPEPDICKKFEFKRSITHVEWSPDSKYLFVNLGFDLDTPGFAPEFNLIDIETGQTVLTRRHQSGQLDVHVNGIGWLSDSERFVTAPMDGMIYVWNLEGEVLKEIDIGTALFVEKMCMIPQQNKAVIVNNLNKVEIVSFDGQPIRYLDLMADKPAAMFVSPNGRYLSISMKTNVDLCRPGQILIYDLETLTFLRALEADTYINKMFVIMPAFLGPNCEILCAGSETGAVHVWHVETGELIDVMYEHSQHSGYATSHPTIPGMMATCSDDNHIIVWVTGDLSRALQDEDEKWSESKRSPLPSVDIKKGW